MQRQRHREFIGFLEALEHDIPARRVVPATLDKISSHKTPEVMRWLVVQIRRMDPFETILESHFRAGGIPGILPQKRLLAALDVPLHANIGVMAKRGRRVHCITIQ